MFTIGYFFTDQAEKIEVHIVAVYIYTLTSRK